MSEENVELVRRAYEVFNEGGPEAMVGAGIWSPEIVWDFTPSGIPGLGVYRGYEEVKSFLEDDWFRAFPIEEWEVAIDELIECGDQVLAMSRQHGRGAASGASTELELGQIVTIRDGAVVRVDNYTDRKMAREAAGLSE